jgi:hydrogenase nickel incorporation protein HypA/HybF
VHEYGLCESVLGVVQDRAAGRRVQRVRVRVGALHRVAEPAFEEAFNAVSSGTVAQDAAVDVVLVPVRMRCNACGLESETDDMYAVCSGCGSADVDTEGGDDLMLESIELEA